MYILNSSKFYEHLKSQGFASIEELSKTLGIHRNTIQYYLAEHPIIADRLEKILNALKLSPAEAIIKRQTETSFTIEPIAPLIDALHQKFPEVTLVLFGSRAQGKAKKYSDWDIGVYGQKNFDRDLFRKIKIYKSKLEEKTPYMINLTHLNDADAPFLKNISRDWIFLAGKQEDWIQLNKKALYEQKR